MRSKKPPVQPEKEVVRDCLEFLSLQRGVTCWRNNTGMALSSYKGKTRAIRYGTVGSADIIGLIAPQGRFLGVECKRVGKEPSDDQKAWLAAVREAGGVALVAHSLQELMDRWNEL